MDPLSGYLVDGDIPLGFCHSLSNRGREQLFQEIIDRLEQEQIQPILCREPPSFLSPGEHPLKTNTASTIAKRCSVRSRANRGSLPCARARTSARRNSPAKATATTTVPRLRLVTISPHRGEPPPHAPARRSLGRFGCLPRGRSRLPSFPSPPL